MQKVDIVIPVYKPGREFIILIERLLCQSIKPENIILIITGEESADKILPFSLASKVKSYNIKKEEFDHANTRNYGIGLTTSKYVIFMTQDAIPFDEELLNELLLPFDDESVAVSYAKQLARKDCDIIETYTRSFNYPDHDIIKSKKQKERMGIKTYFSSDVCACYNKEIFLKNGGFVQRAIFNEDMLYAAKVIENDYKVVYKATAKVIHSHNYNIIQQLKRNFDLGVSQKDNEEVFKGIKSEKEGIKLVKSTAKYLIKKNKPHLIIKLILHTGFKLIGYKLGKNYRILPKRVINSLTMNKGYWEVDKI